MHRNIFDYPLYLLLFLITMAACDTKDGRQRTPNGYDFVFHINKEGNSPQPGDEVNYKLYVRNSDTLVYKSFDGPSNPLPFSTTTLPDPTLEASKSRPHVDALSLMSPGDSVTIFYSIDSLDRRPPNFEGEEFIFYDVVLLDFKKKEVKPKRDPKPLPIDDYQVTPKGYPVVFHIDNEGESPKVGQFIQFRMYIRNDKEVVYSTQKDTPNSESFKTAPYVPAGNSAPQMDAFSMMSPGDSLTLYYQIDTLENKPRGFEDSDMVYYDIVLVDVMTRGEHAAKRTEVNRQREQGKQALVDKGPEIIELLRKTNRQYKNGELVTRMRQTNGGLRYIILEPGDGKPIETGSRVIHHFYCITENDKPFGGSYQTGETYSVIVGERKVITGWENGLRVLKEGSKAVLFVPADQAYGKDGFEGKVPPNTDLLFYIDVVQVR